MAKQQKPVTLADIKKAHGPKYKPLDVPEWGDGATVLAKRLGAPEFIAILAAKPAGKLEGLAAFDWFLVVVQKSLVNADGSQLIEDDNLHLLSDYPLMVTRLGWELLALNGMGGTKKN